MQPGHDGVDYNAVYQDCLASGDGSVVSIRNEPSGYGQLVDVGHADGWMTRYAHLSEIHVQLGQAVVAGERIGVTGNTGSSTGPHMHFETRHHGIPVDPDTVLQGDAPSPGEEADMPRAFFVRAVNQPWVWIIRPDGTRIATTDRAHIDIMAFVGFTSNNGDTVHEWSQADVERFPLAALATTD